MTKQDIELRLSFLYGQESVLQKVTNDHANVKRPARYEGELEHLVSEILHLEKVLEAYGSR